MYLHYIKFHYQSEFNRKCLCGLHTWKFKGFIESWEQQWPFVSRKIYQFLPDLLRVHSFLCVNTLWMKTSPEKITFMQTVQCTTLMSVWLTTALPDTIKAELLEKDQPYSWRGTPTLQHDTPPEIWCTTLVQYMAGIQFLMVTHLFVSRHDKVGPFLHWLGRTDFPVWDVGRNEAEKTFNQDLRAVVHVVLLRGEFCQIILDDQQRKGREVERLWKRKESKEKIKNPVSLSIFLFLLSHKLVNEPKSCTLSQRYSPNLTPRTICW